MRNGLLSCRFAVTLSLIILACASAFAADIRFEDVTDKLGLGEWKTYSYGHGAAWGDVDNDGLPDLYVGAFASYPVYHTDDPPLPNMLFLNKGDHFVLAPERSVRLDGRYANTSGAIFADFDNDGDLDLFVSSFTLSHNMMGKPGDRRIPYGGGPCMLFENLGNGRFAEVTPTPGWPFNLSARNVTSLDLDNDGLLDLLVVDGHYRRWNDVNLIVLRNTGNLVFEDITATFDIPRGGLRGLGMAVGDLNEDGVFDLFIAHSNRLLLSKPGGGYVDWQKGDFPGADWKNSGDAWPCGAQFADLNGDGLLDLVYSIHTVPSRVFVFMNETDDPAKPKLVQRTREAGLEHLVRTKIATLEIRDMDNDGLLDIAPGNFYRDERDIVQPVVFRNLGTKDGIPQFSMPPVDRWIPLYAAAGPLADFDRDGRIDLAMISWQQPGFLVCRNITEGGHWLGVRVKGDGKQHNIMGIGSIVRIYREGHAGEPEHLLGRYDMAIGYGYASGQEAIAHFGLGATTACDMTVSWNGKTKVVKSVTADQTVEVTFPE
jgi:hypothetical protein